MKTWHEAKAEIEPTLQAIEAALPEMVSVKQALEIIKKVAPDWKVWDNRNTDHTHCQYVLTPPNGFTRSVTRQIGWAD